MLAYKYDRVTREYLGSQYAQPDPIEGEYLLPIDCTFDKPPLTPEGYISCYVQNNWIMQLDKRDTWQIRLDDITFSKVDYIGNCKQGYQFITDEEFEKYQNDRDSFKVVDGKWVDITDTQEYRDIKEAKERERVANLECTKRVFVLMLERLGIDYFNQLLPIIEMNRQAKLEWELCVQLQRKNPLIDQIALNFGVTSEQLDILFKIANGEASVEELDATLNKEDK